VTNKPASYLLKNKEVSMFNKQRVLSALFSIFIVFVFLLPSLGISSARATPFCDPIIQFDSSNFPASPKIDNEFLPLVPGTQLTLVGSTSEGSHTVVFTVTSVTKVLDGVNTVVVWDRDFDGTQLAEAELSFFAQDNDGNVWNLGEYPEEYDANGQFTGAPSTWISGVNDGVQPAQGGIHMLAQPKTGTGQYLQGYSPNIDFLDCAKVFKVNQSVCVPVDCYNKVLVTSETSPLDQGGGHQYKYHAPGVGIVQIGAVGDPQAETLALTQLLHLSGSALKNADKEALKLDTHGCQTNDIYSQTCQ
jgi:hypothetical protein